MTRLAILFFCYITFLSSSVLSLNSQNIVNSHRSEPDSHPYHVSVTSKDSNSSVICSGTIIGPQHVVTAGSCVVDTSTGKALAHVVVGAGSVDFENPLFVRRVSKIFLTKNFVNQVPRQKNSEYLEEIEDIAVLKLNDSLPLKARHFLGKVKLAERNFLYHEASAVATGFGIDKLRSHHSNDLEFNNLIKKIWSKKLNYAVSDVVNWTICEEVHDLHVTNADNYICVKIRNSGNIIATIKAICDNDNGGGLVTNNTLIGVHIYKNDNCLDPESIYIKISAFRDFIDKAVAETLDKNIICESLI